MGVLLCRPAAGVWTADETGGRQKLISDAFPWPCAPCACAGCLAFACMQSRECFCMNTQGEWISRMPCVPGIAGMCISACGRYLYQLSSEADCIHTRCTATGELLFAAPAGVFPRCMRMGSNGQQLLCAGGATAEAVMFQTPDLIVERRIPAPHPCFAADFCRDGLLLVCAAEGDDIQTVVCLLPEGGVRARKLLELPGPPGGLCVCPDGVTALISTRCGLAKMDLRSGELMWNCPEWALCMRIECRGCTALISDTLDGRICMFNHLRPWERRLLTVCSDSQACFL